MVINRHVLTAHLRQSVLRWPISNIPTYVHQARYCVQLQITGHVVVFVSSDGSIPTKSFSEGDGFSQLYYGITAVGMLVPLNWNLMQKALMEGLAIRDAAEPTSF